MNIEINLVFVWAAEIDLISVRSSEMGLTSVQGSELTLLCGRPILTWFLCKDIKILLVEWGSKLT